MADPTTPAQAAAAFIGYVRSINADRAMFRDWLGGTPTGGPNDDGRYPLTDFTGNSFLVACPALLAAIGGNLAVAVAALASADLATVGDDVEVIGTPTAGAAPARIPLFEIVNRRTADLNVLQGSEYAEWISCLSSTGLERKLAVSALTRVVGDVIDPTHPPYNVKFDARKAKPVAAFKGFNVIEATDPVFSPADIGKMFAVSGAGDGGTTMRGYIGGCLSPYRVTVFRDAALTQPYAPASLPNGGDAFGGQEMVWGTDSTAGMQAALDDAEPAGVYDYGKIVLLGGMACVTELQFGSVAIVGFSSLSCGFIALPVDNTINPVIYDKQGGKYAKYRPHQYTLKGFQIIGQAYTSGQNSQRDNISVRGGLFADFAFGAPYASVDDLRSSGASWNGGSFFGAYAGDFNNANFGANAFCGMRMGFWDLNGQNWHTEGNGLAGVHSFMPGCNVNGVRSSYNGANAGRAYSDHRDPAGNPISYAHEMGANWCEAGYGNTVTNMRMQESWGHSLIFSGLDPLGVTGSGGQKGNFSFGTFDDTGNIVPAHGGDAYGLPGVRAMVYMKGGQATNNRVRFVQGSGQVKPQNYATNGYFDDGDPSNNSVDIDTPGITNAAADWYDGGPSPATARGPWGTTSSSSIATRGNIVTVNGQTAP